jgi:phosphoglycolate phosphatase
VTPEPGRPPTRASANRSEPDVLAGIDLVVFDKDGTLIDFDLMWGGWLTDLAGGLERATGLNLTADLQVLLGVDPASGAVSAHGLLVATPMARIRDAVTELLRSRGLDPEAAEAALAEAWHPPDPVRLARPLADLPLLLATLRRPGRRLAIATSDDRGPTERTVEALGIGALIDAIACADDRHEPKPSAEPVLALCEALGVPPGRTAVVGDAIADARMGRAAGVARVIGVLSGIGDATTLGPLADVVLDSIGDLVAGAGGSEGAG